VNVGVSGLGEHRAPDTQSVMDHVRALARYRAQSRRPGVSGGTQPGYTSFRQGVTRMPSQFQAQSGRRLVYAS
jgi:hypothetical protein